MPSSGNARPRGEDRKAHARRPPGPGLRGGAGIPRPVRTPASTPGLCRQPVRGRGSRSTGPRSGGCPPRKAGRLRPNGRPYCSEARRGRDARRAPWRTGVLVPDAQGLLGTQVLRHFYGGLLVGDEGEQVDVLLRVDLHGALHLRRILGHLQLHERRCLRGTQVLFPARGAPVRRPVIIPVRTGTGGEQQGGPEEREQPWPQGRSVVHRFSSSPRETSPRDPSRPGSAGVAPLRA